MSVDLDDVPDRLRPAVAATLETVGVGEGHLAVEIVDPGRIQALNREWRDRDRPTDVLAFSLDGPGATAGPRELGDVVICLEHAHDAEEVAVHGVLHLCGYDHETDDGEMLAVQDRIMGRLREEASR
ncbi:MAG: rRNA maturation RNase YbeY [Solirubrobacterales bacterium]